MSSGGDQKCHMPGQGRYLGKGGGPSPLRCQKTCTRARSVHAPTQRLPSTEFCGSESASGISRTYVRVTVVPLEVESLGLMPEIPLQYL